MPEVLYTYHVYILTNKFRGVYYVGVTNDLKARILAHKAGVGSTFTSKNNLYYLMYYEKYEWIQLAIQREKNLKNWHRQWKMNLIKRFNPDMHDIAENWFTPQQIEEKRRDAETSSA
jgi:putative endonuclease